MCVDVGVEVAGVLMHRFWSGRYFCEISTLPSGSPSKDVLKPPLPCFFTAKINPPQAEASPLCTPLLSQGCRRDRAQHPAVAHRHRILGIPRLALHGSNVVRDVPQQQVPVVFVGTAALADHVTSITVVLGGRIDGAETGWMGFV